MPTLNNPQMMRQIIMDHYQNPRNKRTPTGSDYVSVHMDSVSCVDDIYIYLKVENNQVTDCAFDGVGCTISIASTSIMTELVLGKTLEEAELLIKNFTAMVHGESYDEALLDEAIVFMNTSKQASRIKCATIGWDGLHKMIHDHAEHSKDDKHE